VAEGTLALEAIEEAEVDVEAEVGPMLAIPEYHAVLFPGIIS
jgi:hypothetical protein